MTLPHLRKLGQDAARAYGQVVRLKVDELEERKATAKRELILYGIGAAIILATIVTAEGIIGIMVGAAAMCVNGVLMAAAERRYRVAAILLELLEEW